MYRRAVLILAGMALLGLAFIALPQPFGFAQTDPWVGTWQLNLAKSNYNRGAPPRSQSVTVQGEGQNRKITLAGFNAAGNAFTRVYIFIHDSQPHPVTGTPECDEAAYTRVDDNTVKFTCTKGGQVTTTGTDALSSDGKMFTITSIGSDANGRPISNIAVFDKQ
jgi:hypothetical protein